MNLHYEKSNIAVFEFYNCGAGLKTAHRTYCVRVARGGFINLYTPTGV